MKKLIIILALIAITFSCDEKISYGIVKYKEYKPEYITRELRYNLLFKLYLPETVRHSAEYSLHIKTDSVLQKIYVDKIVFDNMKIDENVTIKESIFSTEVLKYSIND